MKIKSIQNMTIPQLGGLDTNLLTENLKSDLETTAVVESLASDFSIQIFKKTLEH